MKRAAYLFGLAALAVNLPRLLIAYLGADWLFVRSEFEGVLLGITAVGTSLVVTAGGLYVIHTLAKGGHAGGVRALLITIWLGLLAALAVLLTPALIANMRQIPLPEALNAMGLQAVWSAVAIVAPEVLAASVMVAAVLTEQPAATNRRKAGRLGRLLDAATERAVSQLVVEDRPVNGKVNGQIGRGGVFGTGEVTTFEAGREALNGQRKLDKAAAIDALLDFYAANPNASQSEAGRHIGRSKSTVGGYLAELEASGLVVRNGNGVHVVDGNEHRTEPIREVVS